MNHPPHHTAGAPVAIFEGYVAGEPAVTWLDRNNMPRAGAKLFGGAAPPAEVAASPIPVEQVEWSHDLQARLIECAKDQDDNIQNVMGEAACLLAALTSRPGAPVAILVAPSCDEDAVRAAFIEWHTDTFGYCFNDEKSFADGNLQAVAWAAWLKAHARIGMAHAQVEIG